MPLIFCSSNMIFFAIISSSTGSSVFIRTCTFISVFSEVVNMEEWQICTGLISILRNNKTTRVIAIFLIICFFFLPLLIRITILSYTVSIYSVVCYIYFFNTKLKYTKLERNGKRCYL